MPAPQFVVVHRSGESEPGAEGAAASNSNGQPSNNNGGDGQGEGQVGSQIENLVNNLLRNFMDVFNGREFLRMQM